MIPREKIIKSLQKSIKKNRPVIGAAVGSGLSARQAVEGGADFVLVLSAGKFRSAGVSSLGCLLPFSNSNDLVMDVGRKEIIPRIKNKPVIFGAFASDITKDHDELLNKIQKEGFDGVNNFPTLGLVDGEYRETLEQSGLGYDNEINLLKKANNRDMFTIAFVVNAEQARKMAEVNTDIICVNLGWTVGGERGVKKRNRLEEKIELVNNIFAAVDQVNPELFKMIYGGGQIKDPEKASFFYQKTEAIGYIGGSSFDRIPTEISIKETAKSFKSYYKIKEENKKLKKELMKKKGFNEIIGQSRPIQKIYDIIDKVAEKNVNVLVQGESGTGKELVVRAIHFNSKRANNAFVKINCATIPPNLLESELFGHEKGAFTGADKQRIGKFELADQGTLFLDEISEMNIDLQAKLLRVIQEQEFQRVGSNETIKTDVRIISATNLDLRKAVADGNFREDLYYRLNVISIDIPPLRERKDDIPLLVDYFLKKSNEKFQRNIKRIEPIVLDTLMEYDWPGNVRELQHIIERAVILSDGKLIKLKDLPQNFVNEEIKEINKIYEKSNSLKSLSENLKLIEKKFIVDTLEKNDWKREKTANKLGVSRKTLYNKMKSYNIKKDNN